MRTCSKCGVSQGFDQFCFLRKQQKWHSWCLACRRDAGRKWRQTNPEKSRTSSKRWCDKNKEHLTLYARARRVVNPEKCRAANRRSHWKHREKYLQQKRDALRKQKEEVIVAYGGHCQCCGETEFEFLTIDHTRNDGHRHRKEVGRGEHVYKWLKRHGFPKDGFQLLCWNCNCAKGKYGTCPHKRALLRLLPKEAA